MPENEQVGKVTVGAGGPAVIESRRREVSHEYATAHDLLDKLGVPRMDHGKSRWLALTERIKRLQQRLHEERSEPDSDTPTPTPQVEERVEYRVLAKGRRGRASILHGDRTTPPTTLEDADRIVTGLAPHYKHVVKQKRTVTYDPWEDVADV